MPKVTKESEFRKKYKAEQQQQYEQAAKYNFPQQGHGKNPVVNKTDLDKYHEAVHTQVAAQGASKTGRFFKRVGTVLSGPLGLAGLIHVGVAVKRARDAGTPMSGWKITGLVIASLATGGLAGGLLVATQRTGNKDNKLMREIVRAQTDANQCLDEEAKLAHNREDYLLGTKRHVGDSRKQECLNGLGEDAKEKISTFYDKLVNNDFPNQNEFKGQLDKHDEVYKNELDRLAQEGDLLKKKLEAAQRLAQRATGPNRKEAESKVKEINRSIKANERSTKQVEKSAKRFHKITRKAMSMSNKQEATKALRTLHTLRAGVRTKQIAANRTQAILKKEIDKWEKESNFLVRLGRKIAHPKAVSWDDTYNKKGYEAAQPKKNGGKSRSEFLQQKNQELQKIKGDLKNVQDNIQHLKKDAQQLDNRTHAVKTTGKFAERAKSRWWQKSQDGRLGKALGDRASIQKDRDYHNYEDRIKAVDEAIQLQEDIMGIDTKIGYNEDAKNYLNTVAEELEGMTLDKDSPRTLQESYIAPREKEIREITMKLEGTEPPLSEIDKMMLEDDKARLEAEVEALKELKTEMGETGATLDSAIEKAQKAMDTKNEELKETKTEKIEERNQKITEAQVHGKSDNRKDTKKDFQKSIEAAKKDKKDSSGKTMEALVSEKERLQQKHDDLENKFERQDFKTQGYELTHHDNIAGTDKMSTLVTKHSDTPKARKVDSSIGTEEAKFRSPHANPAEDVALKFGGQSLETSRALRRSELKSFATDQAQQARDATPSVSDKFDVTADNSDAYIKP